MIWALLLSFSAAQDTCQTTLDDALKMDTNILDSRVDWAPRFAGRAGESDLILLVTEGHRMWRSDDDGVNFLPVVFDAPAEDVQTNVTAVMFTADGDRAFWVMASNGNMVGSEHYLTTRDGGKTFKSHWPNEQRIFWIIPHPTMVNVALGLSYTDPTLGPGYQITYFTSDFGESWERVGKKTTYQSEFVCSVAGCKTMDAIMFQNYEDRASDCADGLCTLERVPFDVKTGKLLSSKAAAVLDTPCDGFMSLRMPWYDEKAQRYLFRSELVSSGLEKQRLSFSVDQGVSWTPMVFPAALSEPHHFQFVTTERNMIMAALRSREKSAEQDYGDLYVSGSTDNIESGRMTLALRHVRMTPPAFWQNNAFTGTIDVERSAELDGVLLANRYRERADGSVDMNCLQTVITYNMGSSWSTLAAPRDSNCRGTCSLHLRVNVQDFPNAYSPDDAVGVWLAQGSVGECMSTDGALHTFYSADAGQTWSTMGEEPMIYEVSNHGALVLGAATERETNVLTYTTNDGQSWGECQFRSQPIFVNNILTRSFNAKKFILEGYSESARGLVITFDFSNVHDRECTDDDYEDWSPAECLLGEHVVWQRRKASSKCLNAEEHEVTKEEHPCECKRSDYTCDFCYRENEKGECVPDDEKLCQAYAKDQTIFCGTDGETQYYETDGYRLQTNNRCQGGVQHGSIKPCPEASKDEGTPGTGGIIAAILVIGLLLVGVVGAGVWVYLRRKKKAHSYASFADEN